MSAPVSSTASTLPSGAQSLRLTAADQPAPDTSDSYTLTDGVSTNCLQATLEKAKTGQAHLFIASLGVIFSCLYIVSGDPSTRLLALVEFNLILVHIIFASRPRPTNTSLANIYAYCRPASTALVVGASLSNRLRLKLQNRPRLSSV